VKGSADTGRGPELPELLLLLIAVRILKRQCSDAAKAARCTVGELVAL
jgi:hypothetical protein